MTTADLINAALKRIGVLAAGETASADAQADALLRLNDLIDQWSAERLTIFTTSRTLFTISQTQDYTIGTGGTVNVARPVFIDHVTLVNNNFSPAEEWSLEPLTDDAWAALPIKALTSPYPSAWYYNPTYPLGTLSLWPIPTSSNLQGALYAPNATGQLAITDTISLPPGYQRFLRENLAVELAPEFGVAPDPMLVQNAIDAKSTVKRANVRLMDLSLDAAILPARPGAYNIYTDEAL